MFVLSNMRMLSSWNSVVVPFQNDGGLCASFTQEPGLSDPWGSSVLPSLHGFDSEMCYQMGAERDPRGLCNSN